MSKKRYSKTEIEIEAEKAREEDRKKIIKKQR